jgi:hypothetical protein
LRKLAGGKNCKAAEDGIRSGFFFVGRQLQVPFDFRFQFEEFSGRNKIL